MDFLKKILGMVFAVLFVMAAVPALLFFNFDRRAFSAETYQKAFADANFFNQLPAVMAEAMLSTNADQSQLPIVMRSMDKTAWEAFFRKLLPEEMLKLMGDDIVNSTFSYLNLRADSVQLSLIPLKVSMTSGTGVQAVYTLLNTQPDCTLEQVFQITLDILSKSEIQLCKPPSELYPLLTPAIQGQMEFATLAIPDQITLISAPVENDPRERLQTARLLMRLSPLLPLGFLLMLTITAVNSLKSWLRWWGVSFIVTGLLAGLISLGGAPIFGKIFQHILVNRMPAFLPTVLLEYAGNLASMMMQAMLTPVLWQGLVIAMIGAASYFVQYNKKMTL